MARHPSNVERIRRPLTLRHALRGIVFAAGVLGGVITAWQIVPRSDLLAFDLGLVQGAAAGALIGLCLAATISLPGTRQGPVRPRPSTFDALVAALDADPSPPAAANPPPPAADPAPPALDADPSPPAADTREPAAADPASRVDPLDVDA